MARYIIGIDEVGRGPLAGPVTLCAVCVNEKKAARVFYELKDIRDSKTLSRGQREACVVKIKEAKRRRQLEFSIASVSAAVIDRRGVSAAIRLAIKRVLERLGKKPDHCRVFLDGSLKAPKAYRFQKTIIKGDSKVKIISTASVIAKVFRDNKMRRLAGRYPGYGFEENVGYGTKAHILAIKKLWPTEIHRRSFLNNLKLKYQNAK